MNLKKNRIMIKADAYVIKESHQIGFFWLIPLYCLAISGAYILASSVFKVTVDTNKLFGVVLSKEQSINLPLFLHLTASVIFFALWQICSRLIGVKMSIGNSILAFLLMVNIFCFVIGINIPLLHTTKLWIIKEHLSLTQVLSALKLKGEIQLYYIMLIFTFIIPLLKMVVMSYEIFLSKAHSSNNIILALLSKWAMLDVLIVGVILSTMKSGSGFADMADTIP
jgi:hypothetical protein